MAVDAIAIGISYSDYWELSPNQVISLFDKLVHMQKVKSDELTFNSWLIGRYMTVAFNDPKKFPNEPISILEYEMSDEDKAIKQEEELIRNLAAIKQKYS